MPLLGSQPPTFNVHNLTKALVHVDDGKGRLSVDPLTKATGQTASKKVTLVDDTGSHSFKIAGAKSSKWTFANLVSDVGGALTAPPPWRIFQSRAPGNVQNLLVLPNRNMASWLSGIADSVPLYNILMPGTHESMAIYGWPFAACQNSSQTVLSQLQNGIRVFDVRLGVVNNTTLTAWHGIISEKVLFSDIVATFSSFLSSAAGENETIVMSIKQEDSSTVSPDLFTTLVGQEIVATSDPANLVGKGVTKLTTGDQPLPAPKEGKVATTSVGDMWFLDNRVPTLGEVRGKIILFTRFGYDGLDWPAGLNGMGIQPVIWPDSDPTGFTWTLGNVTWQMQDWYNIGNITNVAQKFNIASSTVVVDLSLQDPKSANHPVMPMSFCSASSIPLALPGMVANGLGVGTVGYEGVNPRLITWATNFLTAAGPNAIMATSQGAGGTATAQDNQTPPNLQRVCGWLMMDFFDEPTGLVPLLVELNWMNENLGTQSVESPKGWTQWLLGKSK